MNDSRWARVPLLMFVLFACTSDSGSAEFSTTDSAGVTIARNVTLPQAVDSLQPLVRIGDEGADGTEQEAFVYLSDVEVLQDQRIAVVDNRGARVALFDSSGNWLRDLGRRGQGPGEHQGPYSAHIAGDTLHVYDVLARRFNSWLHGDSLIASTSVSRWPRARLADGWIVTGESGQGASPDPALGWIDLVRLPDTTRHRLVGPYPVPKIGQEFNPETNRVTMVNPPTFSATPRWATDGEILVWTSASEPRIEVRDSEGNLERVIVSARAARPTTDVERDAYFTGMQERFGANAETMARMRATHEFASSLPVYVGLLIDDGGRIWANVHDPTSWEGTGAEWDVFDRDGRHPCRVHFPRRIALKRVQDGRAYGVSTTSEGVHLVEVYALSDGDCRD